MEVTSRSLVAACIVVYLLCYFAALAFGILQRKPTQQEVVNLRRVTAALWRAVPRSFLEQVASQEQLTPDQCTEQIASTLWGGLPDIKLLAAALGLSARIVTPDTT
eukprot:6208602-Amphidinium_carterae.1